MHAYDEGFEPPKACAEWCRLRMYDLQVLDDGVTVDLKWWNDHLKDAGHDIRLRGRNLDGRIVTSGKAVVPRNDLRLGSELVNADHDGVGLLFLCAAWRSAHPRRRSARRFPNVVDAHAPAGRDPLDKIKGVLDYCAKTKALPDNSRLTCRDGPTPPAWEFRCSRPICGPSMSTPMPVPRSCSISTECRRSCTRVGWRILRSPISRCAATSATWGSSAGGPRRFRPARSWWRCGSSNAGMPAWPRCATARTRLRACSEVVHRHAFHPQIRQQHDFRCRATLFGRQYPLMDEPRGLTRKTLIASGMSENSIRRALRSGELANVAHGLYLWRKDFDALGTVERHRVHARHVGSTLDTDEAISHISAATLHRIDVWDVSLRRVHVSRPPSRSGRVTAGLHAHTTHWDDGEITHVLGVPVTSIARTIVDLARTLPRDQAIAVGDAGLRLDPGAHPRFPVCSSVPLPLRSGVGVVGIAVPGRP